MLYWGIGGGSTSLGLAPALVFSPLCPSVCPHAAPKTKESGATHVVHFYLLYLLFFVSSLTYFLQCG